MRRAVVLLAALAALGLSSCDMMFETNLFKEAGLGQVSLDKIDTGSQDEIKDVADSPEFYAQLSADPAKRAEVIATLEADPTPQNLTLAAVIRIKTTDAIVIVDNLATQLSNMSGTPDLGAVVGAILPASIASQVTGGADKPPEFEAIIQTFLDAATDFEAVLSALAGADLPSTDYLTAQDTAYYALISVAIKAIQPESGYTAAEVLWAAITGETSPTFTLDPMIFTIDSNDGTETTIEQLLAAAGIDLSAMMN